ncbi:putative metalloenzyme, LuxS/M16 peptidase, tetratricopeptide-like helical domain-containing protein [Rosa chinensis]|uniref:Putative metalloenzyme, LuxS/M16 peptidase, tetratricopeptide-like helical domain-containing protein n=1 Tax=Rosa chinensis TaxID=74649 RepID=A0A2P6QKR8_ROSCH|nr:putative metalloenzyme, LuxS/M16 peptidase, tetratricopeptide-like helical domain-containing protein [Rosa chinensis]
MLFSLSVNNFIMALFHSRQTHVERKPASKPKVEEDALKLFREMLHSRPLPCVVRFTQLLGQLVKLKHYSAVISLNRQMLLSGIASDDYTLNIIIKCYCHLNQMGFGLSVLGTFFKLGLQPDVVTFTTLINGFVLHNQVPEAARIFTKMLETGHCKPNVVTFNTLMKGFCMRGDNTAAIQLLGKMEEERGCEPNVVSYSTIIDSLCKDTLIDEAFNLFAEMISRGITPDVVTYTSLIHGVCKLGQWKQATRLLDEMLSTCIFPDVCTFNVLVDTFCKEGMVMEAKSVIQKMIQRHIQPDTITYNSLMDGYCLRGGTDKARQVFDVMISKGSMVDVQSCSILIHGYCKGKMLDKAYKIFKEMPRMELVPDTVTYTTLIDGLCKVGRIQEAEELFSEMQGCGQLPNVQTYAVILYGLCNNHQLSTAVELLTEMEARELELDIVIYNIVIEGLCKAGEIESARDLFCGLSSKGVQPNVRTHTVMIHGLCHHGFIVEAEKLLREMGGKGCSPNGWTYNTIIRGFINNNETSRATRLIQEMLERGFSADASTMELIVDLLSKDTAAAAICVGIGSFSDPMGAQGLAHFLEHMLFMGSTKFPVKNEPAEGIESIRLRALIDLFDEIIEKPFYDQLRTKEQLGYVQCDWKLISGVFGFYFIVQSSEYNPIYLQRRVDNFMNGLEDILDWMMNYRGGLMAKLLAKNSFFINETDRLESDYPGKRHCVYPLCLVLYTFDYAKRVAEELSSLQKEDVVNFYKTYLQQSSPKHQRLAIRVWGCKTDLKEAAELRRESLQIIEDLEAFKMSSVFYPNGC